MSKPFVAICIPSMTTMCSDTVLALLGLVQYETQRGTRLITLNMQSSVITHSRNQLVIKALDFDPKITHILWIDSDMTFPDTALRTPSFSRKRCCWRVLFAQDLSPYNGWLPHR